DPPGGSVARHEDRPAVLLPPVLPGREPVRQRGQPQPLSRPARAHRLAVVRELPSHPYPCGGRGDVSTPDDGVARTSHRLQLPRDTDPAAVLTMVRNVRPE